MSFQVKQLSSASSTGVNKENIASANMSDEEPQDDQELVNIAAAEKQSGTEHSGTRSGLGAGVFTCGSWGNKADIVQRQDICLGNKLMYLAKIH